MNGRVGWKVRLGLLAVVGIVAAFMITSLNRDVPSDRELMWKTTMLGVARDPSRGPGAYASTDHAIDAAYRVFAATPLVGKTPDEVIALLGDPRTSSNSIYNFPFYPPPVGAMVYRFDNGVYGVQFNLLIGDDGRVSEIRSHPIE